MNEIHFSPTRKIHRKFQISNEHVAYFTEIL